MAVNALEGLIQGKAAPEATAADKQKALENTLLGGDPQALVQLRQIEADFTVKMEQLGIDKTKLIYEDIANARAREVAVKDSTPRELAFLIIGGFLAASIARSLR